MKRLSMLALVAAVAASAGVARAQDRAIPLPDTLGANFNAADSATAAGAAGDYDFLVGVWHFTFQTRKNDGGWNPPFDGHWMVEKKSAQNFTVLPPGRKDSLHIETAFVEDHWRGDSPHAPMSSGTYTYRTYNSQLRVWQLEGVDAGGGFWNPGLSWSDAQARYLVQHYGKTQIMRIKYFAIAPDEFLWRADMSTDGGKTWMLDRWTMKATRVAR